MNALQQTLLRWRKRIFIVLGSVLALSLLVWGASLYLAYRDQQARQAKTAVLMQQAEATMKAQAPQLLPLLEEFDMRFTLVPSGTFAMGLSVNQVLLLCQDYGYHYCDPDAMFDNAPQRTVVLDSFWIGQTEVTNAQYQHFIDAGGYKDPQYWSEEGWQWLDDSDAFSCGFDSLYQGTRVKGRRKPDLSAEPGAPNLPVTCIGWYEAEAYARWLAHKTGLPVRLPTEAEWEKAARGDDERLYPWGNDWNKRNGNFWDRCCSTFDKYLYDDGYVNAAPVGSFPNGVSPYGGLDMAGNVEEWVIDYWAPDYYARYPQGTESNPQGPPTGLGRVIRGGSWGNALTSVMTVERGNESPTRQEDRYGFRLVVAGK